MILSIDTEKATDKVQHPFLIKTLHGAGIDGTEPQYHKSHLQKAHREYHSPWGKNEGFSPKVRSMAGMSTLTTVVQHSTRSPSLSNQITKRNKRHLNPQRRSQTLFADVILYVWNMEHYGIWWNKTPQYGIWWNKTPPQTCQNSYRNSANWQDRKISAQTSVAFLQTNDETEEREIKESNPFTIAPKTVRLEIRNKPNILHGALGVIRK